MTIREQVLEKFGGKCKFCEETRYPALLILTTHKRTGTWDRYYQDLYSGAYDLTIECKNCNAVMKTKKFKESSTETLLFVKGVLGGTYPWVHKFKLKTVVIDIDTNEAYYYPDYLKYEGKMPDLSSFDVYTEYEVEA